VPTEVNFYHLTKASLEDALPRLLVKTLQAGERAVVMLGSPERVDASTRISGPTIPTASCRTARPATARLRASRCG